jgi:hypothetical protein
MLDGVSTLDMVHSARDDVSTLQATLATVDTGLGAVEAAADAVDNARSGVRRVVKLVVFVLVVGAIVGAVVAVTRSGDTDEQ